MKDSKTADSSKKQKRRSEGKEGVITKKQKTNAVARNGVEEVERLGALVLQSEKNYNNIVKLLENVQSRTDLSLTKASVSSLQSVFVTLMERKRLSRHKSDSDAQKKVVEWLRERYREYQTELLNFIRHGSPKLRTVGLDQLLECAIAEGRYLRPSKDEYWFPEPLFRSMIDAMLDSPSLDDSFLSDFAANFADRFGDLTYYTYTTLRTLAERQAEEKASANWKANYLQLLQCLNGFPVSDEIEEPPESILGDFSSASKTPTPLRPHALKRAYQECWLATLRHIVSGEDLKSLLNQRSHQLISKFANPELLMDFYTDCYNQGGAMSLVALEGLFQLIVKRNLDYPDFYTKFYSLFDRDVMHIKYRSHFFRLADIFLASTHLPGALVASFMKRMARLSLHAPPAAIVTVIPFVYNLLKKHPSCLFMLHRSGYDREALRKTGMDDPFLEDETDPLKTNAIDSSLWELVMLQDHYNPNVGRFCKVLSEQFTKPAFNLEDFLDHSYTSMMEEDWKKEIKKPVAIEYELSYLLSGPAKATVETETKNRFLTFAV